MELVSHKPKNAVNHEPLDTPDRKFLVSAASAASAITEIAAISNPRTALRHAGVSIRPTNLHARANQ